MGWFCYLVNDADGVPDVDLLVRLPQLTLPVHRLPQQQLTQVVLIELLPSADRRVTDSGGDGTAAGRGGTHLSLQWWYPCSPAMSSTAVRMWSKAWSHRGETWVCLEALEEQSRRTHPLVDLLVDGGLPVGGARNFEPLHQRFDSQTLKAETGSDRS